MPANLLAPPPAHGSNLRKPARSQEGSGQELFCPCGACCQYWYWRIEARRIERHMRGTRGGGWRETKKSHQVKLGQWFSRRVVARSRNSGLTLATSADWRSKPERLTTGRGQRAHLEHERLMSCWLAFNQWGPNEAREREREAGGETCRQSLAWPGANSQS